VTTTDTTTEPTTISGVIARALEVHQAEWIDHDTGWECGCNEHGDLGSLPSSDAVHQHQAAAVQRAIAGFGHVVVPAPTCAFNADTDAERCRQAADAIERDYLPGRDTREMVARLLRHCADAMEREMAGGAR
jgi:hypothetical protein